jgi:hypothetical protein
MLNGSLGQRRFMEKTPDDKRPDAVVSNVPPVLRSGAIAQLARALEIDVTDFVSAEPLECVRSDPAGLDGHAVFDLELASALERVEDFETRSNLERLLRTLETFRRGRRTDAATAGGATEIDRG